MTLVAGTKLGEILAPLGAGGMGEVYRAGGTKLKHHDVSLRVLPEAINPAIPLLGRCGFWKNRSVGTRAVKSKLLCCIPEIAT